MFLKVKDIYVIFSANVEFSGKKILTYKCTLAQKQVSHSSQQWVILVQLKMMIMQNSNRPSSEKTQTATLVEESKMSSCIDTLTNAHPHRLQCARG